jgi:hypothetical protein
MASNRDLSGRTWKGVKTDRSWVFQGANFPTLNNGKTVWVGEMVDSGRKKMYRESFARLEARKSEPINKTFKVFENLTSNRFSVD